MPPTKKRKGTAPKPPTARTAAASKRAKARGGKTSAKPAKAKVSAVPGESSKRRKSTRNGGALPTTSAAAEGLTQLIQTSQDPETPAPPSAAAVKSEASSARIDWSAKDEIMLQAMYDYGLYMVPLQSARDKGNRIRDFEKATGLQWVQSCRRRQETFRLYKAFLNSYNKQVNRSGGAGRAESVEVECVDARNLPALPPCFRLIGRLFGQFLALGGKGHKGKKKKGKVKRPEGAGGSDGSDDGGDGGGGGGMKYFETMGDGDGSKTYVTMGSPQIKALQESQATLRTTPVDWTANFVKSNTLHVAHMNAALLMHGGKLGAAALKFTGAGAKARKKAVLLTVLEAKEDEEAAIACRGDERKQSKAKSGKGKGKARAPAAHDVESETDDDLFFSRASAHERCALLYFVYVVLAQADLAPGRPRSCPPSQPQEEEEEEEEEEGDETALAERERRAMAMEQEARKRRRQRSSSSSSSAAAALDKYVPKRAPRSSNKQQSRDGGRGGGGSSSMAIDEGSKSSSGGYG